MFLILLKILAQALGASAGTEIVKITSLLVSGAARGDEEKKAEIATRLLMDSAKNCPEAIQKLADKAIADCVAQAKVK